MADVIPFRGILYNPQKVDPSSVMAPPYDIVTPEFKDILYNRNPFNVIRIDFGKDSAGDNERENRYTRASKLLDEWLKQGILIMDSEPSFYCYEASYRIEGQEKKLRGFLGAVKIEELGTGKIYPHEMTYSKPKTDRLNILRFCRANISPIFSLYSSQDRSASSILRKVIRRDVLIESRNGDGFTHKVWKIRDKNTIDTIKRELSDKEIFIADGHHRYETALEFKNEMAKKGLLKTGTEPFNYVMMFLANIEDNGLTALPTHRLTHIDKRGNIEESLRHYFDITTIHFDSSTVEQAKQDMLESMQNSKNARNRDVPTFGMFLKGKKAFHVLKFKGSPSDIDAHRSLRNIDATVLHKFIFEKLLGIKNFEYEMDTDLVIKKIQEGSFHTAFFLNPTKIQDVKEVALAGQRMPPKSTYFYPKLLTGMVMYKF